MDSIRFVVTLSIHKIIDAPGTRPGRGASDQEKAAATIIQSVQILKQHPQIGQPVKDMEPEYREFRIGFGHYGYVEVYRLDGDAVIVVANVNNILKKAPKRYGGVNSKKRAGRELQMTIPT